MAHGAHRWTALALRGLFAAFLWAFCASASAQYAQACPACADIARQLTEVQDKIDDLQVERRQIIDNRIDASNNKNEVAEARANAQLDAVDKQLSNLYDKSAKLRDELQACLEKNCPQVAAHGPTSKPPTVPPIKTCPPCQVIATWLQGQLQAVADLQRLIDVSQDEVSRLTDKGARGRPMTSDDKDAYARSQRYIENATSEIQKREVHIRALRIELAACERKCAPPGTTPVNEGPKPPSPPCPACADLAKKVADAAQKVSDLRAEIDQMLGPDAHSKHPVGLNQQEAAKWDEMEAAEKQLLELQDALDACIAKNCTPPGTKPVNEGPQPPPVCPQCKEAADKVAKAEQSIRETKQKLQEIKGRLDSGQGNHFDEIAQDTLQEQLDAAEKELPLLKAALADCIKEHCTPPPETVPGFTRPPEKKPQYRPGGLVEQIVGGTVALESVRNISGNNPFDPQNPLGPATQPTPAGPATCTGPRPLDDTQTQACPAGQSGSITQTRSYSCVGTTWTPGPFTTTSNTCSSQPATCTGPKPPDDTQSLACPAGQTGTILQTRTYSCVGTTWTPGPFTTTSNSCTTPVVPGCTSAFTNGIYSCSGSCGISAVGLAPVLGNTSMIVNPFGSNSNPSFSCQGVAATSASNNLTILGQPGHTCTLTSSGTNAFSLGCRNTSGGSCSSTCTR